MNIKFSWQNLKSNWRTIAIGFLIFLILFVLLGTVSVAGWEYSNSNSFCGNACHQVHPEEPYAHERSNHAQVKCVECHVGRLSFFPSMIEKSGHVAHAWSVIVGYERPLYSKSMGTAERSCEGCHTLEPHRYNTIHVLKRYADDKQNTEKKTLLTLRLAGRHYGGEDRRGVNWHASGAVRFIADDPQNIDIRWVEATLPGGSIETYTNVTAPITQDEIAQADVNVMDCIDCHNRAGHAFLNPEEEIDAALAEGRLSRSLPFIKARSVALLEQEFSTEEEARQLVQQAWDDYEAEFPDLAENKVDEWDEARDFLLERQESMANLMVRSSFVQEDGISWRSFPDHNGHKDAPGCFRCHSGRLQNEEGKPIPVNCTTCHSIPLVTTRDRVPDHFLTLVDMRKPRSHRDPAWISKHMTLVDERCTGCHEEVDYGTDDKTYCSNSGCHAQNWEYLDLKALQDEAPVEDEAATAGSVDVGQFK